MIRRAFGFRTILKWRGGEKGNSWIRQNGIRCFSTVKSTGEDANEEFPSNLIMTEDISKLIKEQNAVITGWELARGMEMMREYRATAYSSHESGSRAI